MLQAFTRSTLWLLSFLIILAVLLSPATNFAAQAAADDTPTLFALDQEIEDWTVGAGQAYWSYFCNEEFATQAQLKRKAVGGTTLQTLKTIDPPNTADTQCLTFRNMLSTGDGLFYFHQGFVDPDIVLSIRRMPLSPPFEPVTVKILTNAEQPETKFVEVGDFLYWGNLFGTPKILRTLKDGSGAIELVTTPEGNPSDLLLAGTTLFWSDTKGIWSIETTCTPLPCTTRKQYDGFIGNGIASGLVYQPTTGGGPFGGSGFRIYWVQKVGNVFRIYYRSCSTGPIVAIPCYITFAPDDENPTPLPDPPTIFHEASEGRAIGAPVFAEGNLYWPEIENVVNTTTGDIYRKATTAGANVQNISTNQSGLQMKLFVANANLFFARNFGGANVTDGIYTLSLFASAIERDFTLEAAEVTQAIQNLANEAPLVAEKTTYVRAYAKQTSGPSTANVEIVLHGTRNNVALPGSPLKPVNGVRALTTGGSFDRAKLNDGWYFLLPKSWTAVGNVQLRLVVDPRLLHTDPTRPNEITIPVTFVNQLPVCVVTVPVRTHNPLPSVNDPNVGRMVSNFTRLWPVPESWIFQDTSSVEELEVCWWYAVPYPCFGPYELSDGWGITNGIPDRDKVIASLWARAQLSFNPDACDDIGAPVHYMGLVHPDADNGGAAGYASTVSKQSWVQLPPRGPIANSWDAIPQGSTMAQELAHNHGRGHVDCGGPDNVDNGFPYPNKCNLAPTGPTSYYGFDVSTRQPIRPNQAADFMSYGFRTWVSDYTWKGMLGEFATANVAQVGPLANDQSDQVFVTGMVDVENPRGEITIVLILPANTLPPATRQRIALSAAGVQHGAEPHLTYKLRLLDAEGATVEDRPLTLLPMDDHAGDSETALFNEIFDKPAEPVAKILLMADSTPVYTITAGINAPVVSVQEPVAGAVIENSMTIQWTASDPDPTDQLKFTVQYSYNGTEWHTLAINLPSTPDPLNTLTLTDLGSLQGSATNAAKIRVLASDGYNTTIATSQGFTVKNRPPVPVISSPTDGQTLVGGQAIVLQGTATDPEDGGLDESGLTWRIDGSAVGNGATLAVDGLASGVHTATLTATDSNSQTVTVTVSFTLAPLAIPQAALPTFDGLCNDTGYVNGINLLLSEYGDDTQANVRIFRSDDYLWACFANLKLGAAAPGAYAGLRVDVNNSRDPLAQATDFGFFVGENGDVFARVGNGAGDFVAPGPDGLQGQMVADANGWSAELRIEKGVLGGWDKIVNMAVGHHSVAAEDDDYVWPFKAEWAKPNTWSTAALGDQPVITAISPASALVGSSTFSITVEGSGFVNGTQVVWNSSVLPTIFGGTDLLTATVTNTLLSTAAIAQVTARSPGNLNSNSMPFVVEAPAPNITSLSPANTPAGSNALLLTVNGANFAADSKVLWNGTELTTQFVNSTQLTVQLDAALLEVGQIIGVVVSNPTPEVQMSSIATFEVLPESLSNSESKNYLPGLFK